MLLFLMLFLTIECFGVSLSSQSIPLSMLNLMRSRIKVTLKFNQTSIDRIASHALLLQNYLETVESTIKGLIKYGNKHGFSTETVFGQLDEMVGPSCMAFDSSTPQNSDGQEPQFTNRYPLDIQVRLTLDPVKFGLSSETDLTLTMRNNYSEIEVAPAMKQLIAKLAKKGSSIN